MNINEERELYMSYDELCRVTDMEKVKKAFEMLVNAGITIEEIEIALKTLKNK